MEVPDRLLSAKECSERTGLPVTWFWSMARRNLLPHYRFSRYYLFSWEEICRELHQGCGQEGPESEEG